DVLVEISHCGICGTDLHLVFEHYAQPGSILGHEWSGTVVDAGANGRAQWPDGARVVGNPAAGCGRCRACRRGRPSVCLARPAPAPVRRARALEIGAAGVVVPQELPQSTTGRPPEHPYSVVFECSGNARAAEAAFDQLDYAGTLVFVGTGHEPPKINHNRMIV